MRKLLVAVAVILGIGLVVGSAITPTTAQPVEGCKKSGTC